MNTKIKLLSSIAMFMVVVVIVLGAFTRLVDAGLGCPDWPTCYGHLWVPNSEAEITKANQTFEATPVETNKTWPEQIHRIFASSLGLIILAMFAFAAIERKRLGLPWKPNTLFLGLLVLATIVRGLAGDSLDLPLIVLAFGYFGFLSWQAKVEGPSRSPFKLLALLAGFVIMQGWFGMWTVTLKLWPQVVTIHLLGGFTTLVLIWVCIQRSAGFEWKVSDPNILVQIKTFIPLIWLFFGLIVLQIALGGWTTSNYAALACPDFPTCHAQWWPHTDFVQGFNIFQQLGPNYLGGQLDNHARTAIHLSHRIGALLVLLVGVILIGGLWRTSLPYLRRFALLIASILAAQIALGITNVVTGLPLAVAVAHNAGGAVLLTCVVTLIHRVYSLKIVNSDD